MLFLKRAVRNDFYFSIVFVACKYSNMQVLSLYFALQSLLIFYYWLIQYLFILHSESMIRACKLHFNAWNDTWIPFNRIIPFLYQFGTSGNEIGKAKSQFSKHKTVFAKWSLNFANFTSVCAKLIWKRYRSEVLKEDHAFRLKNRLFWKGIIPYHGMNLSCTFCYLWFSIMYT